MLVLGLGIPGTGLLVHACSHTTLPPRSPVSSPLLCSGSGRQSLFRPSLLLSLDDSLTPTQPVWHEGASRLPSTFPLHAASCSTSSTYTKSPVSLVCVCLRCQGHYFRHYDNHFPSLNRVNLLTSLSLSVDRTRVPSLRCFVAAQLSSFDNIQAIQRVRTYDSSADCVCMIYF